MVTSSKVKSTLSVVNPRSDGDSEETLPVTATEEVEATPGIPDTPVQNEAREVDIQEPVDPESAAEEVEASVEIADSPVQDEVQEGDIQEDIQEPIDLDSPELYLNRELTWLEFNRRVLREAFDESNPLLERLKYVGIVSSNLDEFFMKRIGGLKQQVGAGILDYSVDGRLPARQIEECYVKVRELEAEKEELIPELIEQLSQQEIHITAFDALSDANQELIRNYYFDNIYPLVTPQGVDSAHPFPFISNLSLNLLVTLRHSDNEDEMRARVKVPVGLGIPRFLQVPESFIFVPLESVMAENLDLLFPKMEIVDSELFYVTRNANTARDEDEADDLLAIIESEVRHRRFAKIARGGAARYGSDPARHARRRTGSRRDRCLPEERPVGDAGSARIM